MQSCLLLQPAHCILALSGLFWLCTLQLFVHVAKCCVCVYGILDSSGTHGTQLWNDLISVLGPVASVVLQMKSTTDSMFSWMSTVVSWNMRQTQLGSISPITGEMCGSVFTYHNLNKTATWSLLTNTGSTTLQQHGRSCRTWAVPLCSSMAAPAEHGQNRSVAARSLLPNMGSAAL